MRETKQWLSMWNRVICTDRLYVFRGVRSCSESHSSSIVSFPHRFVPMSNVASPPCQAPIHLILPHLDDLTQHPPIKLANSSLASSLLIPISSISSKFFLPQKSFTPLTSRLLIFSTSGSSTAAKQILK